MQTNNIRSLVSWLAAAFGLSLTIILVFALASDPREREHASRLSREAIVSQVSGSLSNKGIVQMIARENTARGDLRLMHCIEDPGICHAKTKQYFKFRQGLDETLPLVAGDYEEPVRVPWTTDCASPECPAWEVRSWFRAHCQNEADSCARVKKLELGVEVEAVHATNGEDQMHEKVVTIDY